MSAAKSKKIHFPPQIKYIVGNEACERFSYYGMRSILVIYMAKYLGLAENQSSATYHLFVSASYFLPLFGGILADRFLGKYKTIMALSLVYCAGHAVLALFEGNLNGLYLGLGLIAIGAGGIKPCVSAHVGDQFGEKDKHLMAKVFDIFYFSVNFGSMFSQILIPWTLPNWGAAWAFGIPGILMFLATWVFWLGRDLYVHVPPTGKTGEAGFAPIFWYSLTHLGSRKAGQGFFDIARAKYTAREVEGAKAAANVINVFAFVVMFWALYDQTGSSWTLQAEKMNREVLGYHLEASQIQAVNSIFVLILIPLFSLGIYPWFEKLGYQVTPLRKMGVGMFLTSLSFVFVAIFQAALDSGISVNVGWQVLPYLILTAAEVMISITGLEFAYTQAPRAMKSTLMSFWLLTISFGNLISAYVSGVNTFSGANYFWFFAIMMFIVAIGFVFAASKYKVREFIETNIRPGTA